MFNFDQAKFTAQRGLSKKICNYYLTLDIETSSLDDCTLVWSYQQGIAMFNSENGELLSYKETRCINDLVDTLVQINSELNNKGTLYIFVHNLSFDLSFFRTTLIQKLTELDNSIKYSDLLIGNKEWLSFSIANLDFRCSYKLTLMSLYTFTKTMNVQHVKLLGLNDYGIHYSDEELGKDFHTYMYNDVVGLGEAIYKLMKVEKLTLRTLPLTSTGFIRNELKHNFKSNICAINSSYMMKPCVHEFMLWNDAYHGGLNVVNMHFVNRTIHNDKIRHLDFVSHYPTLLLTKLYPSGNSNYYEFTEYTELNAKWLKDTVYNSDTVLIAKVKVLNYRPSLTGFNILSQDNDIYTLCTPDLMSLYEFATLDAIYPIEVYTYSAKYLPEEIINITKKYFYDKCILKEKIKTCKLTNNIDTLELEAEYARKKVKLNSIAGLLQQKPFNDTYTIDEYGNSSYNSKFDLSDARAISDVLDNFYGTRGNTYKQGEINKGKCFHFIYGVFLTAYGRYELLHACNTAGFNNVLYSDTDSLFYIENDNNIEALKSLNEHYRQTAISNNAYVDIDINGTIKRCYLSWLDDENETIIYFKALSTKRYMYYSVEHGLKLVCSSIAKGCDLYEDEEHNAHYKYTREMEICGLSEPAELTLSDVHNGFNNFTAGFVFEKCTSTLLIKPNIKNEYITINSHKQYVDNGTIIRRAKIELHATSSSLIDSINNYSDVVSGYTQFKEDDIL